MISHLVVEDANNTLVLVHFVVLVGQHRLVWAVRRGEVEQGKVASGVTHGQDLTSYELGTAELGLGVWRLEVTKPIN